MKEGATGASLLPRKCSIELGRYNHKCGPRFPRSIDKLMCKAGATHRSPFPSVVCAEVPTAVATRCAKSLLLISLNSNRKSRWVRRSFLPSAPLEREGATSRVGCDFPGKVEELMCRAGAIKEPLFPLERRETGGNCDYLHWSLLLCHASQNAGRHDQCCGRSYSQQCQSNDQAVTTVRLFCPSLQSHW